MQTKTERDCRSEEGNLYTNKMMLNGNEDASNAVWVSAGQKSKKLLYDVVVICGIIKKYGNCP